MHINMYIYILKHTNAITGMRTVKKHNTKSVIQLGK